VSKSQAEHAAVRKYSEVFWPCPRHRTRWLLSRVSGPVKKNRALRIFCTTLPRAPLAFMKCFLLVGFALGLTTAADLFGLSDGGLIPIVTLDGTVYRVASWEGGDPRASVVTENLGPPNQPKKNVADITLDPISIEVPLPLPAAFLALLTDFCINQATSKTLFLSQYSPVPVPGISSLQVNQAILTAVKFPAFDTGSTVTAQISFVFNPMSESFVGAPAAPAAIVSVPPISSANYALQIDGVNSSRITHLEPFVITRPIPVNPIGPTTQPSGPAVVAFPDLVMRIAPADAADWTAWRDSFFFDGHHLDADEKSGSLALGVPGTTGGLTLQLSHIGPKSAFISGKSGSSPSHVFSGV
jgi:hypothetical protein